MYIRLANLRSERLVTAASTVTLAIVFGLFNCQMTLAADSNGAAKQISTEAPNQTSDKVSKQTGDVKDPEEGAHCHISKSESYKKVSCDHPHAACAESEKIIETLKLMSQLYTDGKFDEYSKFIDKDVTTFDERKNKLIVGKDAVLDDMKSRWTAAHAGDSPIVSFSINHPYAQVNGDQAVVTFEAVKVMGGKNPETMVSRCTDIFVKKDGTWKKLHYRSNWKKCKTIAHTS